jgi:hypothetical protein
MIHVSFESDPLIWVPAWLTLALLVTAAIVAGLQVREAGAFEQSRCGRTLMSTSI